MQHYIAQRSVASARHGGVRRTSTGGVTRGRVGEVETGKLTAPCLMRYGLESRATQAGNSNELIVIRVCPMYPQLPQYFSSPW